MLSKKEFNTIIAGVGGQGLITLLRILAEAALFEGLDVKTSELHGLSQREGSVQTHIRFGKKVFSPLIQKGKADLVLGLEVCEALRVVDFLNKNTIFLINKKFISYLGGLSEKEVFEKIQKIPGKVHLIEASKICQEKLDKEILAGVFLLGFAASKKLIPLGFESIEKAIKKIIPEKYLRLNLQALELAKTTVCKERRK